MDDPTKKLSQLAKELKESSEAGQARFAAAMEEYIDACYSGDKNLIESKRNDCIACTEAMLDNMAVFGNKMHDLGLGKVMSLLHKFSRKM